jgi:predicted Zn-dependent peptidase
VVAEVERRFGQFNGPAAPLPLPATFGGGVKLEARDLEQVHIALALEGLSQKHADYFSLQVFAIVLGGGMSSRLFQEVREKRGLCYTISAFHMPYSDTGMFGIYAGTDAGDVKQLMRVAVDETAAATANITEAEVNRAKAQIKVGLLMALESSGARARQLASQILTYGRPLAIEEIVARIDNVSVASTRAAGTALLARGRSAIAALGPGKGLESAATIVESLNRRAA